jgi:phenol hydroxylase P1 protein
MTIEIKTATLEPVRNTFAHIARRFGDKPATRYQEGTYDVQAVINFHYKPLWQPELELNDPRRTAIVMEDWYELRDPRQFYYGTYVQQRAKMQEVAESNYNSFEKRQLAELLSDEVKQKLVRFLVPLRHVEHTANLNNVYGTAYGYGTAVTQALLFDGMDRFGIAQYLSRIALILDGNTGEKLVEAKSYWMDDPVWQGLRALCEETLVTKDWFELLLAQDLVIDTLVYDLFYDQFEQALREQGAQDVGMLMEFMQVWHKDTSRWVDAVIKRAAAESDHNRAILEGWVSDWRTKTEQALQPLAEALLDNDALAQAAAILDKRVQKAGLFQ